MALIREERFRLRKCGGHLVAQAVGGDGPRAVDLGPFVCVGAIGLSLLLVAAMLVMPRGVALRESFHNTVAGHVIPHPRGWLAGYGNGYSTYIRGRIDSNSRSTIVFQSRLPESFGLTSYSPDALPAVALSLAHEHGFRAAAKRYRVRGIRFMGIPGLIIQGPARSGWGWLIVALDGTKAEVLIMTTTSSIAAKSLAPTWRRIIAGSRRAQTLEVEEAPPWD